MPHNSSYQSTALSTSCIFLVIYSYNGRDHSVSTLLSASIHVEPVVVQNSSSAVCRLWWFRRYMRAVIIVAKIRIRIVNLFILKNTSR